MTRKIVHSLESGDLFFFADQLQPGGASDAHIVIHVSVDADVDRDYDVTLRSLSSDGELVLSPRELCDEVLT